MDEPTRKKLNAFVKGLRDTADRDYIAARATARLGLFQISAWLGLQAIEKYFKAILLFNDRSVREHRSHELLKLLNHVKTLPHIGFHIPDGLDPFLEYLTQQGNNRYSDIPAYAYGNEIVELDGLVWHVRRFCQDFLLLPGDDLRYPGKSQERIASVPADRMSASIRDFAVRGGFLEKVIQGKRSELRSQLIWRNAFYGERRKTKRGRYRATFSWRRPAHVMFPELLPVLKSRVYFSKDVMAALEQHEEDSRKRGLTKS